MPRSTWTHAALPILTKLHCSSALAQDKGSGAGECSAIAVAVHRGFALAIDDNRAVNRALREAGLARRKLEILRTQDLIVALIRAGVLDIAAADQIKDEWANQHRFRIKGASFSDLLKE